MVWIEIDDEVWELYKKSWALFGVRTHEELVKTLNNSLWDDSIVVLEDSERHLISNEPEALMRREIGLTKEKMLKQLIERGLSQEEARKYVENFQNGLPCGDSVE